METAQGDIEGNGGIDGREKEPSQAEKQFLKELYMFMRRRDTPIERIPNLGFKQIDLYLMYVTVSELGGYQQVTAQQLWKQVYNALGGNPRSTSAATCTRRHYEKLLLPYECHMKGVLMAPPLQLQPKHYQPGQYGKGEGDGPLAVNGRLLSVGLAQNVYPLQSNKHRSAFHQPFPTPHLYHQSHTSPPPLFQRPPSVLPRLTPAALQPNFFFEPYSHSTVEVAKEPLEHLRYLAERYKSSSGLSEPLNLSVRAPKREAPADMASSSFAPPPSIKNPRFLNKPSPLYSRPVAKVARSEQSEAHGEVHSKAVSGPTPQSALSPQSDERPGSPKTSEPLPQPRERRTEGPEVRGQSIHPLLNAGLSRENQKGEMEIEIPLSVFQKWLQLCKFPEQRRPPEPQREQHFTQEGRSVSEAPQQNATVRLSPPTAEDLSTKRPLAEDLSTKRPTAEDLSTKRPANCHHQHHHLTGHHPSGSYNSPPSLGIPPGPPSLDGKRPIDRHSHVPQLYTAVKSSDSWGAGEQTSSSDLPRLQQSREASRSYGEDASQRKKHIEMLPPAVLFLNSTSSSPLLQLTSDEVMKLKKIISNSS